MTTTLAAISSVPTSQPFAMIAPARSFCPPCWYGMCKTAVMSPPRNPNINIAMVVLVAGLVGCGNDDSAVMGWDGLSGGKGEQIAAIDSCSIERWCSDQARKQRLDGHNTAAGSDLVPVTFERSCLVVNTGQRCYGFVVELAVTPKQQELGLMYRNSIGFDEGMLFRIDPPSPVSFWMKDTAISLDMIFIGVDGTVLQIAERTTPNSSKVERCNGLVGAVLELKAGTSRQIGIAPGARILHKLL